MRLEAIEHSLALCFKWVGRGLSVVARAAGGGARKCVTISNDLLDARSGNHISRHIGGHVCSVLPGHVGGCVCDYCVDFGIEEDCHRVDGLGVGRLGIHHAAVEKGHRAAIVLAGVDENVPILAGLRRVYRIIGC
jgi:hypothetical protein